MYRIEGLPKSPDADILSLWSSDVIVQVHRSHWNLSNDMLFFGIDQQMWNLCNDFIWQTFSVIFTVELFVLRMWPIAAFLSFALWIILFNRGFYVYFLYFCSPHVKYFIFRTWMTEQMHQIQSSRVHKFIKRIPRVNLNSFFFLLSSNAITLNMLWNKFDLSSCINTKKKNRSRPDTTHTHPFIFQGSRKLRKYNNIHPRWFSAVVSSCLKPLVFWLSFYTYLESRTIWSFNTHSPKEHAFATAKNGGCRSNAFSI